MSELLMPPTITIQSVVAQARAAQIRGEWRTAFQELPPLRRFPPPEKQSKSNAQAKSGSQQHTTPKQPLSATPRGSQPNDAFWTQPLGQHFDAFA